MVPDFTALARCQAGLVDVFGLVVLEGGCDFPSNRRHSLGIKRGNGRGKGRCLGMGVSGKEKSEGTESLKETRGPPKYPEQRTGHSITVTPVTLRVADRAYWTRSRHDSGTETSRKPALRIEGSRMTRFERESAGFFEYGRGDWRCYCSVPVRIIPRSSRERGTAG